jgi:hypothetical protein
MEKNYLTLTNGISRHSICEKKEFEGENLLVFDCKR